MQKYLKTQFETVSLQIFAGVTAQISTEAVLLLWGENVDIIMDEVCWDIHVHVHYIVI